jgi:hypothetical protein
MDGSIFLEVAVLDDFFHHHLVVDGVAVAILLS